MPNQCTARKTLALLSLGIWPWALNAATNLGLLIQDGTPVLSLNFGNPTDYAPAKPAPVSLTLGTSGQRFHGSSAVHLEETGPENPPGQFLYGGPGDSWSDLILVSPTPGSTRDEPILCRFDSRIDNRNTAIGYTTSAGTALPLRWDFAGPGDRVYFRVEWSVHFVGTPFVEQSCFFDPVHFTFNCTDVLVPSSATFQAGVSIAGFGSRNIPGNDRPSIVLGPGSMSYSGSMSGVANASYLGLEFSQGFYVGQSHRGNSHVIADFRVFADLEPLPDPGPPAVKAAMNAAHQLTLNWPSAAEGYQVQQTQDLGSPNWTPVTVLPVDDGRHQTVLVPPFDGQVFYRLIKP
jgi:hypothetical protein